MTNPPSSPPPDDDFQQGDGYSEEDAEADRKAEADFFERLNRTLEEMPKLDIAATSRRPKRPNVLDRMFDRVFKYGGQWPQPIQSARAVPIGELLLPGRGSDPANIPNVETGEPLPPILVVQQSWEPPTYRVLAGARVVEHCRRAGLPSVEALVLFLDEQAIWLLVAWGLGSVPWPIDPLRPGLPE